jgi:hypothetical protein
MPRHDGRKEALAMARSDHGTARELLRLAAAGTRGSLAGDQLRRAVAAVEAAADAEEGATPPGELEVDA